MQIAALKQRLEDASRWGDEPFTRSTPVPVAVLTSNNIPSDVEEELEELRTQVHDLKRENTDLAKAVSE